MGQKLGDDNIPKLVVASTTTATLAITNGGQPTLCTIAGQQYTPASLLTLNAATVGANGLDAGSLGASQLWYVYAIANQSTFAMALVASLSATPTMPTGYGTAYKLVGGFNTNASSQVSFTVTPEDGNVYPVSAGNVVGRTDGTAVPAGYIGQVLTQSRVYSGRANLTSSTAFNVTATPLTLTPGVWSMGAFVGYRSGTSTNSTSFIFSISKTSATFPAGDVRAVPTAGESMGANEFISITTTNADLVYSIPASPVVITADTTFYLVARATWTTSTMEVYGSITAVRIA